METGLVLLIVGVLSVVNVVVLIVMRERIRLYRDDVKRWRDDMIKSGMTEVLINDLACESVNGFLSEKREGVRGLLNDYGKKKFDEYVEEYTKILGDMGYKVDSDDKK